ncbi:MAG: penicillin-binding protein [Chloroflexi bacterium]|nr:MAG: penicillin-binding protein [Chloroflexota bacterium]
MSIYDLQPRQTPQPPRPRGGRVSQPNSLWRGFVSGLLAFVALAAFGLSAALIGYALIARTLPNPNDPNAWPASDLQSSRIFDREGNLLYETMNPNDPNAGRRMAMPLDRISPYLIAATIATEDANFYRHQGVDPIALVRALYYAVQERDIVSGASTIPQQLVKRVFLSPEQTMMRKVREAILAAEVSRLKEKDEILEIYLNDLFYGNLAYGAAAAAETYFGKDVADLTLAEAALLAGLPQLPAYYDPYTQPERAKRRQGVVLGLMVEAGYISQADADAAWLEPLAYEPFQWDMKAPHFTLYVRQQLEQYFGKPDAIYQTAYNITTSLDPHLQAEAERIVRDQIALLGNHNVSNGALVALRPDTGEIVAFVGSADFNNVEIDGQVNMVLAPRQPGSTIKPLVYLAAFEQPNRPPAERWTPGTLVADIKEEFPDGANPPYIPTNYDNKERGMVIMRTALANSLNIPAVRAIQDAGLPQFLATAQRVGITTLTRPDYGLSLSLGAGEIPLLEMTGAFAVLANNGVRVPPQAILKITDNLGNVYCDAADPARPCSRDPLAAGQQVVNPVDAFLLTEILSDNEARTPVFGPNSLLRLDRPAAAKTGTTNDFRDVLTLGYTPQLVTGVWVGNADNSPMIQISGITGAAPIWNEFMRTALAGEPMLEFTPPPGVRQYEVCAETGTLPSEACPERRMRWFAEDRPPLPPEKDLYQLVRLDRVTGRLANEYTPADAIEERVFKIYPPQYRQWAEEHGIPQPPEDDGDVFDFASEVIIRSPAEGEVLDGVVTVVGSANVAEFGNYELQYGISHDPGAFSPPIAGPFAAPVVDGTLGLWDTTGLGDGPHTLRLVVRNNVGHEFEQRVRVFISRATPTWTPEATPTWTPVPTETPVFEEPPTATPEPTWTLPPVDTPVVEEPPVQELPTETPVVEEPPAEEPPTETPVIEEPPLEEPTPTWTPEAEAADAGEVAPSVEVTTSEVVTTSVVITENELVTESQP